MKVLRFLIITTLILFPFGEVLRVTVGNNIVIKPLDISVGLTAAWWLFLFAKNSKKLSVRPMIAFAGIGLLSLLLNITWLAQSEFITSLFYLLRWVSYAGLFFAVLSCDQAFKKKIGWILFTDGLSILIVGYVQYLFFSNLKVLYHLGWDEHMYRLFSVFFDPNFAGGFFVLYFLFTASLFARALQQKNRLRSMLLGFVLFATLFAIFLTFSRASLLMLIVGAGVFLFLLQQKKLFFGLLGIMLLFFVAISSQFYIENINIFREASSKARLGNYAVAIQIITERPLLGVGFNSYRYAKELYGIKSGWTGAPSHADAGVDNSFLFVLATTGIVGFVMYLWLWSSLLRRAFLARKKKDPLLSTVAIASIVGLFVHALFINSLFFAPIMLWMWVLFGLVLNFDC